jgi:hypothetical protein
MRKSQANKPLDAAESLCAPDITINNVCRDQINIYNVRTVQQTGPRFSRNFVVGFIMGMGFV